MKNISENTLREIVSDVISGIPAHYRCYELMRKLKEVFKTKGVNLEVRDGSVLYCPLTLLEEAYKKNCEVFFHTSVTAEEVMAAAEAAAKKAKGKRLKEAMNWKIIVFHSWGILPKEKYLIDCQASIDMSRFPDLSLFDEFPVLRKIILIRIVPLTRSIGHSARYSLGDDIFLEMTTQKGNIIKYKHTDYSVELRV